MPARYWRFPLANQVNPNPSLQPRSFSHHSATDTRVVPSPDISDRSSDPLPLPIVRIDLTMGIIIPHSRALSQQVFSRAPNICAARFATSLRRVNPAYNGESKSTSHRNPVEVRSVFSQCRSYATATATTTIKTPAKPRTRTAATKKSTPATTRKPAAKKAKKPKPKSKTKKRAKAKPKPKPKPRRRVLTEKQKAAKTKLEALQKTRDLKAKALLTAPKSLPYTAWQVLTQEYSRGKKGVTVVTLSKEAATTYKNLTPEERERLNHTANENKAKNETAYKQWLSMYTPKQVKEANNARQALKRANKKAGGHKMYASIHDSRLVKQPVSPYTYFLVERNATGDFTGMKIAELGGLVGKEWKALSSSDKKVSDS